MQKINACQYCGGNSKINTRLGKQQVICNRCKARGPLVVGEKEAIDQWNKHSEVKTTTLSPEARKFINNLTYTVPFTELDSKSFKSGWDSCVQEFKDYLKEANNG